MFTKLLLFLGLAATLTSAFAIPTATLNTKQVWLHLFHEDNCNSAPAYMPVTADTCYAFAPGVKSLRVIGHDEGVKYNALKVYSAVDCESGPVLQPIMTDACSAVVAYKGIKLSINTSRT
ncbi:hypothetical protein yc1106_05959 [Curvularia clavata]|uniref:Uncharacterized protein n=1 Tax=Curvularia clavata TaxID=95742 RepID=A0A9Q9DU65_CURCL|nr:hypothetical protein yc1106_05959 [Curvularia clavata]